MAVAALVAAACAGEPRPEAAASAEPVRLLALAPSLVETLFYLGYGERLVAVGDFAAWPPAAAELPRVGDLFAPQIERIAALEPDLAFVLPSETRLAAQLAALGVETVTLRQESLEDVERSMVAITERLAGAPAPAARAAIERWRRQLAAVAPLAGRPRVALAVAREAGRLGDVLVAGPGTFLDQLLGRVGAVNAFADAGAAYPQVGLEAILARRPAAVIELQPGGRSAADRTRLVADWERLGVGLCVAVIAGDYTLLPGPRLPRLAAELAAAIARCGERR